MAFDPHGFDLPGDAAPPAQSHRNTVLAAALVIYGTLFLLLVTIPGSVTSWLEGMDTGVIQQAALQAATAVRTGSERSGLAAPYQWARKAFLEQIRGE